MSSTGASRSNVLSSALVPAYRSFTSSFVTAYALRGALGVLRRALHLLRINPTALLSISEIVTEREVIFREQAIRYGLSVGTCVALYTFVLRVCRFFEEKRAQQSPSSPPTGRTYAPFYAGCASVFGLLFLGRETRQTLALYAFARALQTMYARLEQENKISGIIGSRASDFLRNNGSGLVFILSSAQIMYAYVIRPDTLPKSYWEFIVKTGPISKARLHAAKCCANGVEPDWDALGLAPTPSRMVTCGVFHHENESCVSFVMDVLLSSLKKAAVLYVPLNMISYMVFGIKRYLKSPGASTLAMNLGMIRSTLFLGVFVAGYQAAVCTFQKCSVRAANHKLAYFVAGLFSSCSIYIEKRSRRSELALYVLPRALSSLLQICAGKTHINVPWMEFPVFALSAGILMYSYEYDGKTLAPFVSTILRTIVPKQEK